MENLNQRKGKELEISLYIITDKEEVRENVFKEREFVGFSSHIQIEIIPPSGYCTIFRNRAHSYEDRIDAQNVSKALIVTYQRKTIDLDKSGVYFDPTKIYVLNAYSDSELCDLSTEISADKIRMLAAPLFSLHPFCGEWEVEDKEKGVWLVLSPESMYQLS